MRSVWRVEHAESKHGPYYDDLNFQDRMDGMGMEHNPLLHPVSGWESQDAFGPYLRFGFESREQMADWFGYFGDAGWDALRDNGFHVCQYEVEDDAVHEYPHQVTFNVNRARKVACEEL